MARYVATVQTPLQAREAFAFMSDMRLFASWDPSIVRAVQVVGNGPGPDAVVDLVIAGLGPWRTLRYEVLEFEPGRSMTIEARSRFVTSHDVITVEPKPGGSVVTYDAEFTPNGPARLAAPGMAVAFRLLSDRAAAGLRAALTASAWGTASA